MYLNKALIYGNMTRDPELKSMPSGSAVANFSVATNRNWKDKEGNKKEDVQFHNIVCFGKTAEIVSQYLRKGSGILIEGRIQTRSWEKDGIKKYTTEIIAESVQFGPKSGAKPEEVQDDDGFGTFGKEKVEPTVQLDAPTDPLDDAF